MPKVLTIEPSSIIETIRQQCKALNIPIRTKDKGYLNNLTMNKPHQGVVLKASIRETIPITSLSIKDTSYIATPKNPAKNDIILQKLDSRAPLWIALDELQDPQNLGSILRTAHFFGVDGVLLCSKNSAPLSPAVSKVSSGAMEVMDIYSTSSLVRFLKSSSEQGWSIVGAAGHVANCESVANIAARVHSSSPSERTPTVLVLGNEGVGLRTNVKACCHHFVSIPGQVSTEFMGHVDSLNVGVAAGILIAGIMAPL
ncbi:Alpha/beta knot methyltransferase [Radiomyces spectabilis]|uniref:Alpha/beta knot methyltransferase n=1 Tax=Radiomyces spectabilis TaxID=64574 RepID=UPI002220C8B2|nr:Alpha/beta knot methyltransferase [Radiomyces spectabilis]KAI8379160.1 Alpha/beta knot methyltransferase [Radiomyces spectabilis]